MPIEYALYENHLTANPNDYRAQVRAVGSITQEDLIEDVVAAGSTLGHADLRAAAYALDHALAVRLADGYSVTTPTGIYLATMRGTFNGPHDRFDPARHSLHMLYKPGTLLRQMLDQATTLKQEATERSPRLVDYTDINSDQRNTRLTAGGMGQVRGHRLKHDPTDPEQGIFVLHPTGEESRITLIAKNMPREQIFLLPADLPPGTYHLEVRTRPSDALRTGRLAHPLTVG